MSNFYYQREINELNAIYHESTYVEFIHIYTMYIYFN